MLQLLTVKTKNLILGMGMALSFDHCRKHDPRETKENLWPAYPLFLSKKYAMENQIRHLS